MLTIPRILKNTKDYINNFNLLVVGMIIPTKLVFGQILRILFLGRNLFLLRNSLILVLVGIIYSFLKYSITDEFELAHFGIIGGVLSFKSIKRNNYFIIFSKRKAYALVVFSLIILFLNSSYLKLDPNYISLTFLLIAIMLWSQGQLFSSFLLIVITSFYYSRSFLAGSLIFFLFKIPSLNARDRVNYPITKTIFIYTLYFIVSGYILFILLDGNMPEYLFLEGFDRINRIIDTSNWIRFTANFRMFNELNLETLIFGFTDAISFPEFPGKSIYPHNLFLGLMYNTGIIWTTYYTYFLIKSSAKFKDLFYIIGLYQVILGFGTFYIYVLPLISIINNSYEKSIVNRR